MLDFKHIKKIGFKKQWPFHHNLFNNQSRKQSMEQYLDEIRPYLCYASGRWKIKLITKMKFRSPVGSNENCMLYTKSHVPMAAE